MMPSSVVEEWNGLESSHLYFSYSDNLGVFEGFSKQNTNLLLK
jgi:hypothetical protein